VPVALQEVLGRALAKSPEARFATAIEMSAALRAAIAPDLPAAPRIAKRSAGRRRDKSCHPKLLLMMRNEALPSASWPDLSGL
jgi:hypothetical protein